MQRRSHWETLGFAIAAGLLVILLLPIGRSLFGGASRPGQQRVEGPARGVVATLEHWLDRLLHLDFTGPGGPLVDRLELALLLIMVLSVGLLVFTPRLLLIAVGLVASMVLLEPLLNRFTDPSPRSSNGPGESSWFDVNLWPGYLGQAEVLVLLGIAVVIAFLVAQRRPREREGSRQPLSRQRGVTSPGDRSDV